MSMYIYYILYIDNFMYIHTHIWIYLLMKDEHDDIPARSFSLMPMSSVRPTLVVDDEVLDGWFRLY